MNSIQAQTIIKGSLQSDNSVSGTITIRPPTKKPTLSHRGIFIQLYGFICNFHTAIEKLCFSNKNFLYQKIELAPSGKLSKETLFPFSFQNIQLPLESYIGNRFMVKYGLRTIIKRKWASDKVQDTPIIIRHSGENKEQRGKILRHLSFFQRFDLQIFFQKAVFDLNEIMKGTLKFEGLKNQVKTVQVKIVRFEKFLINNCPVVQDELISYQVMEQVREGEEIEVRLCLRDIRGLTPSYESLGEYVSVYHQLKIVLGVEDGTIIIRRFPIKFIRA